MQGGTATHARADEVLVARARDGDRSAVAELCGRWRSTLVRFCCRYLHDHDAAEDAAQEVLAKLAIDGSFRGGSSNDSGTALGLDPSGEVFVAGAANAAGTSS